MRDSMKRRDVLKGIGAGTIGLGFGVSLLDGIYQYAEGVSGDEEHALLMKGSVNFMGLRQERSPRTANSISRLTRTMFRPSTPGLSDFGSRVSSENR
jgi:hypothetical protein